MLALLAFLGQLLVTFTAFGSLALVALALRLAFITLALCFALLGFSLLALLVFGGLAVAFALLLLRPVAAGLLLLLPALLAALRVGFAPGVGRRLKPLHVAVVVGQALLVAPVQLVPARTRRGVLAVAAGTVGGGAGVACLLACVGFGAAAVIGAPLALAFGLFAQFAVVALGRDAFALLREADFPFGQIAASYGLDAFLVGAALSHLGRPFERRLDAREAALARAALGLLQRARQVLAVELVQLVGHVEQAAGLGDGGQAGRQGHQHRQRPALQ
ncbi:MAG: hypothetical protein ACOVRP_05515, partial [Gemmatimonas sp.]